MNDENPAPSDATPTVLRPLGTVEHLFHNLNPVLSTMFSFAIHLDRVVDVDLVRRAAAAAQAAHPLLAARVLDGVPTRWVSTAQPVPVATAPEADWREVLAAEQANPFIAQSGPLWRLILIGQSPADIVGAQGDRAACTIVVSFAHEMIDGIGAGYVLGELVRALNGVPLSAHRVPEAQEDLIPPAPNAAANGTDGADGPAADPRMSAPGQLVPLDGRRPWVSSVTLNTDQTAAVIGGARENHTTVHGALAAAAHVAARRAGRDYVRLMHPADLRRLASSRTDEAAMRLVQPAVRTASDAPADADFWELARTIRSDLLTLNTLEAASASAALLASAPPPTPAATAAAIAEQAGGDVMLTNVGIVELAGDAIRVVGLSPFAMWLRMRGYAVISVATFDGQLSMTLTTDDPTMRLLDDMVAILDASAPTSLSP